MAKIVSKGRKTWKDGSVMTYSITDDGVLTISGSLSDDCEVPVKSKAPFHHMVIEDGVQAIGSRNFIRMDCLEELTLPPSVKTIGEAAFLQCDNLRRINFSDGLVSIGRAAFMLCPKLARIVFPDGLKEIGCCAFADCTALRKIRIPASVQCICGRAFMGCDSLNAIVLPKGDVQLDGNAFGKAVKCVVKGEDGFDYSCTIHNMKTDRAWVSIRPSEKVEGAVIVPSYAEYEGKSYPVTIIEKDAFSGMGIKSVVLPDTVVEIEDSAFRNCPKLVEASLGKSLKMIGNLAFESCKWLRALNIPETVIQVGYHAIEGTRILELQRGVIYLGHVLYGYNGWLPEHSYIEVRKGTTVIADSAFNRKDVYLDEWKNLEGVVLPEGIKRVGDAAFLMCRELKHVNLPKTLEYIGSSAFSGTGVRDVSVPWKKPIELGVPPFENGTVIRVPKGTAETYSKMSGWGDRWKHYEFVEKC